MIVFYSTPTVLTLPDNWVGAVEVGAAHDNLTDSDVVTLQIGQAQYSFTQNEALQIAQLLREAGGS